VIPARTRAFDWPSRYARHNLKENGPVRKDFVQIFLVRERLGAEHGVIPASAKDPVIPGRSEAYSRNRFECRRGLLLLRDLPGQD